MPARDYYHDAVRNALVREGWAITHDPYLIPVGMDKVYVDLGAERTIAADRGDEKIAVEIKSFLGASEIQDFERALGQYMFYRPHLADFEPDRKLVLGVPLSAYDSLFRRPIVEVPLETYRISYLVFDPSREAILRWMN